MMTLSPTNKWQEFFFKICLFSQIFWFWMKTYMFANVSLLCNDMMLENCGWISLTYTFIVCRGCMMSCTPFMCSSTSPSPNPNPLPKKSPHFVNVKGKILIQEPHITPSLVICWKTQCQGEATKKLKGL